MVLINSILGHEHGRKEKQVRYDSVLDALNKGGVGGLGGKGERMKK